MLVVSFEVVERSVEAAFGGGSVAREIVEELDIFVCPEPGVARKPYFDLVQAFLIELQEPVRLGGFVDQRGGGGVLWIVRVRPALEGELEFRRDLRRAGPEFQSGSRG